VKNKVKSTYYSITPEQARGIKELAGFAVKRTDQKNKICLAFEDGREMIINGRDYDLDFSKMTKETKDIFAAAYISAEMMPSVELKQQSAAFPAVSENGRPLFSLESTISRFVAQAEKENTIRQPDSALSEADKYISQ